MANEANIINTPYKTIALTKGYVAIVDPDWHEMLSLIRWTYNKGYAETRSGKQRKHESMHRVIMDAQPGQEVDHINGDKLDNRKLNLRLCTRNQNIQHRKGFGGTSQFKGVRLNYGKWDALIKHNKKSYFLGRFDCELEAARAYNEAATRLHGDFAYLNAV